MILVSCGRDIFRAVERVEDVVGDRARFVRFGGGSDMSTMGSLVFREMYEREIEKGNGLGLEAELKSFGVA
jgi:hypothetical protein